MNFALFQVAIIASTTLLASVSGSPAPAPPAQAIVRGYAGAGCTGELLNEFTWDLGQSKCFDFNRPYAKSVAYEDPRPSPVQYEHPIVAYLNVNGDQNTCANPDNLGSVNLGPAWTVCPPGITVCGCMDAGVGFNFQGINFFQDS